MLQTGPIYPDDVTEQATVNDELIQRLVDRYIKDGPNPEYRAFEARMAVLQNGRRRAYSVWEFIQNAVEGSGGFANGGYLFPFRSEIDAGTGSAVLTDRLAQRMLQADYDRFAEHVCNAPWDLITSASDMIERRAEDPASKPLLPDFWADVDGNGTPMYDFLEFPHRQARLYGTGWIFMDRPKAALETKADDLAPENRPYLFAIPTQDVVEWEFDEDGDLSGLIYLEAGPNPDKPRLRVWTESQWGVFDEVSSASPSLSDGTRAGSKSYALVDFGDNALGEIPVVCCYNSPPDPKRALGRSEMLDVGRLAQTVYNIDSEAREIERKCALFLALPMKNLSDLDGGKVTIGPDAAFAYTGDAGKPAWISPDLTVLDKLAEKRKAKKADAYQMAGLGALAGFVGNVQTRSGFHAEVEFSKTERRVARHASMLEQTEKRIARLYLLFYGIDADENPGMFSVTYPRDFGVRDMEKLINDTTAVLNLNVGDTWAKAALQKLARAEFPRRAEEEIVQMVDETVAARSLAAKQQTALGRVQSLVAKAVPRPVIPVQSMRMSDYEVAAGGGGAPNA